VINAGGFGAKQHPTQNAARPKKTCANNRERQFAGASKKNLAGKKPKKGLTRSNKLQNLPKKSQIEETLNFTNRSEGDFKANNGFGVPGSAATERLFGFKLTCLKHRVGKK